MTEKKLPVADVASRLGVSTHSLYAWIKRYSKPQAERQQDDDQHAELSRLRAELRRKLVSWLRSGRALRVPRARAQAKVWAHVSEDVMISSRPAVVYPGIGRAT